MLLCFFFHLAVDKVEETRLTFLEIVGNILITISGNLTITGDLQLTTVRNRLVLTFDGKGTLSLGELTSPCLQNPELCLFGFTLTFSIRYAALVFMYFTSTDFAFSQACCLIKAGWFANELQLFGDTCLSTVASSFLKNVCSG